MGINVHAYKVITNFIWPQFITNDIDSNQTNLMIHTHTVSKHRSN